MTQYLTCAQGMPASIEKALTKCLTGFVWDGSGKPNASLNLLCAPANQGGKDLLNLKCRNEAIELVWLKKLLSPAHKWPTWASFANAILNHFAKRSPTVPKEARISCFLQSWNMSPTKIPSHLKRILKVAKAHKLSLDATTFHPDLLRSAPIWFHVGATQALNCLNNHHDAFCLRRHGVISVGEVITLTEQMLVYDHRPSNYCQCAMCAYIRSTYDCPQPNKCLSLAKNLLLCLPAKWLPSENQRDVTEDTTAEPMPQGEACEFRANLVTSTHLEDAFRIIRPDTRIHPLPARRRAIADQPHPPLEADVHCCASSMATQDGLHIIGGCAWFGETDAQNITLQLPPNECFSKTTGILGAMLLLLQSVEPEVHLRIHLNDNNILRNLTKRFGYNEDLDWFHVQDGTCTGHSLQSSSPDQPVHR